jgi:hypothetical protein
MKRYALAVLIIVLFTLQGYCQENQASNSQDASRAASSAIAAPAQTASVEAANPQEISIYGEVRSVNAAVSSIVVQYYDYDSDNEKSIEITAANNTKIEGVSTINDIRQGAWADINYTVVNGKNMAKSIAVEKEENAATETPAS